ncbi:MAG: Gfo/Idh/MocA family oxidoreductase [Bacteroidota bacterium]
MIKIGLLGVGHLGNIHLRLIRELPEFQLVGFFDPDSEKAATIQQDTGIPAFESMEALLERVDAVDIVTPTLTHFACAKAAIEAGKHVFIEKPLTHTLEEGRKLLDLFAAHPDLLFQVGHVERFNPAFLAVEDRKLSPMFIEGHRLAMYNPRGTDVSVVLDLMIHDLDVVLSLVPAPVKEVHASGVHVVSNSPDIANARIEFENGCVANLTASRISMKNMRRLRLFQQNTYLAVDFLKKSAEVFRLSDEKVGPASFEFDTGTETKYLVFEQPEVTENNAIKQELEEFAHAIQGKRAVRVPLQDGFRALEVAHLILEKIDEGHRLAQV